MLHFTYNLETLQPCKSLFSFPDLSVIVLCISLKYIKKPTRQCFCFRFALHHCISVKEFKRKEANFYIYPGISFALPSFLRILVSPW